MFHALRIGAAVILVWFAIYGMGPRQETPPLSVDPPAAELRDKLAPVAKVLRKASPVDRALWAEVWEKSAKTVAGDTATNAVLSDTKALRAFTVIVLDVAWSRIAGNVPGKYTGLREATEAFLADRDVLGIDDVPVTPEVRVRYIDAAKALAYAGINKG